MLKYNGTLEDKLESKLESKLELLPKLLAIDLSAVQVAQIWEIDLDAVTSRGENGGSRE